MLDVQVPHSFHFPPAPIDKPLRFPGFPSGFLGSERASPLDRGAVSARLPQTEVPGIDARAFVRRHHTQEQDCRSEKARTPRPKMQQAPANVPTMNRDYRDADPTFRSRAFNRPDEPFPPMSSTYGTASVPGHVNFNDRNHGHHGTSHTYTKPPSTSNSQFLSPRLSHPAVSSHTHTRGEGQASANANDIHPYLQLPSTISSTKGSLTEFAAQITCLFWFESSSTLSRIEDVRLSPMPRAALVPDAFPSTGFLKWVTTILSTTQVTQNVILLALLFVQRLKKLNPTVKGKPGSEFRLFTVALMLGNKFLDDNTYTNKTWAEVSGIAVTEIHVMEVEFLSHMKYNLFTSKEEWQEWHAQLQHLWRYFNSPHPNHTNYGAKLHSLRPPSLHIPPHLPSPPPSTNASPPYPMSNSPGFRPYYGQPVPVSQPAPPQVSPTNSTTELDSGHSGRKRSVGDGIQKPPAKRPHGYDPHQAPRGTLPSIAMPQSSNPPRLPSLPIPNLPLPSSQPLQNHTPSNLTPTSTSRTRHNALPPFNWNGLGAPSSTSLPYHQQSAKVNANGHHDRASRQHTPFNKTPSNPSPVAQHFPSAATHTASQNHMSPSFFLSQRNSPYKPVRGISTLLVPPPSGQLNAEPQSVPYEQMHWQPLGKPVNERRTGRVPYLHREAWPESNQVDQWPPAMYPVHMRG